MGDNNKNQVNQAMEQDVLFGESMGTPDGILSKTPEDENKALKLKSNSIDDAMTGTYVKTALLPEDAAVEPVNYTLDFNGVEQISQYQMRALDELLIDDDDAKAIRIKEEEEKQLHPDKNSKKYGSSIIPIYVWANKDVLKLGYGYLETVSRLLPQIVQRVFVGQCKLYRDVKPGETAHLASGKNLDALVMQI